MYQEYSIQKGDPCLELFIKGKSVQSFIEEDFSFFLKKICKKKIAS